MRIIEILKGRISVSEKDRAKQNLRYCWWNMPDACRARMPVYSFFALVFTSLFFAFLAEITWPPLAFIGVGIGILVAGLVAYGDIKTFGGDR